ncbi:hypothetical protein [Shinella sp. M27]|uniref:hypothetical protein n=1 Tax=Shinella sp. M27 TaxID=3368614 RepID=UPI003BA37E40
MTTPSSPVDSIAKAMEGVTPGPWNDSRDIRIRGQHDVGLSICFVNCENGSRTDREARANAAYIAACSPDRMREVLDLARQAEAMKREMAEKDAEIARLRDALKFYATPSIYLPHPLGPAFDRRTSLYHAAKDALGGTHARD